MLLLPVDLCASVKRAHACEHTTFAIHFDLALITDAHATEDPTWLARFIFAAD
jgi:hypothetical protein